MSKVENKKETSKEVVIKNGNGNGHAISNDLIAALVLNGDLSQMTPVMKVQYYNEVCRTLSLNPVTRPFEIIKFDGKEQLYANKSCTEQLRKLNGVSVVESVSEIKDGLCITRVKVQDNTGRYDLSTGAVSVAFTAIKDNKVIHTPLTGKDLANAIMKSETKAKRRATLSICGLGMLDESELDTMYDYSTTPIENVKIEKPTFQETVKNYLSTLKTKKELDAAYETAKARKQFTELTQDEQKEIEDAYLELSKNFEPKKESDGIPFEIPKEEKEITAADVLFGDEMPEEKIKGGKS